MPKRENSRGKLKSHLEVENYCRDVNRTFHKKAKLCGPKAKKKKLCEKAFVFIFLVFFFLPQSSKGKARRKKDENVRRNFDRVHKGLRGKTGRGWMEIARIKLNDL
jgi:hypothetical protein